MLAGAPARLQGFASRRSIVPVPFSSSQLGNDVPRAKHGVSKLLEGDNGPGGADTHEVSKKQAVEERSAAHTMKVVHACRAFAAAFEDAHKEQDIRKLLVECSPANIEAGFAAIDLEGFLTVEHAQEAFRTGCGYHPWLLGPEAGLRGLIKDTLELCRGPMQQTLTAAGEALTLAAETAALRCASMAARAGTRGGGPSDGREGSPQEGGSGSTGEGAMLEWLQEQAKQSVTRWKQATWAQLEALLAAEASFPTPSHFSSLKLQLQALLLERQRQAALLAGKEAAAALLAAAESHGLRHGEFPGEAKQVAKVAPEGREGDPYNVFFMGWMDKLSRRGKWQRRWFVLSGEQQCMYYYHDPEEVPARAVIQLRGVSLVMEALPLAASISSLKQSLPYMGVTTVSGKGQHVFQIQMPAQGVGKEPSGKAMVAPITLRCADLGTKHEWVERISRVARGLPFDAAAPEAPQASSKPGAGLGDPPGAGTVPRKISARVFRVEEAQLSGLPAQRPRCSMGGEAGSKAGGEGEAAAGGSSEEEAAEHLIHEIVHAHEEAAVALGSDERELLECVIQGAREYVQAAHVRLAELTGKVINQGMLGRVDDLYCDLLGLLSSHEGSLTVLAG